MTWKQPDFELEKKLDELAMELRDSYEPSLQPCCPWVLIRVLPKEMLVRGIILPEHRIHKPNYEGIVLKVFKPRMEKHVDKDGTEHWVERTPIVGVGDHIVCPHYEGVPTPFMHEDKYRIIKDDVIICTVGYDGQTMKEWLSERLSKWFPVMNMSERIDYNLVAKEILEDADVFRKDLVSKIESGARN